jgi:hypothetical protein
MTPTRLRVAAESRRAEGSRFIRTDESSRKLLTNFLADGPPARRSAGGGAFHLQNSRAFGVHSPMPLATMLPITEQT